MTQAASPFVWGAGGARMTPEQIAKQREIAEAMIARGVDTSPVGHWTQGAARVAQALFGSIGASRADAAEKESMERSRAMLMGAIGGDNAADTPAPGAVATSTGPTDVPGDLGAYAKAIQSIESGGKYDIVGPTHPRYGRALGAYQVMEANLPEWSKAALGRVVTPDEFLKSREVQDQVFQHRFGGYLNRFGNPQDAASAWFTGQPLAKGANRRDVLGTTGSGYVDKFNRFLGRNAADLPAPGASPTSMPGAGEGFAVPTQGVAETEDDVRRMELATGMRPPTDMETLFAPQQMPGAPAFQPAAPAIDRQAILDGYQIGAPAAPSMTMAPIEPGVGMPPQQVAAPLPPPRPADLPAPGAREAVAQAMMPQTGVYGRSGDGSEWELYQYEDDNGRIMYGTRARGAANSPGQSLAPADTPGAGVLTGQGGGIARVAQAMLGGGGQAPVAPVAAPAASSAPAGAAPAGGVPAASGGRAQQLIMLATDPTVPGSVRQVAMALYQQEAEKNKPRDMVIKEVNGRVIAVDPRNAQARDITPEGMPQKQGFRQATPEEAAKFGASGGQFGPDGRFYPINPPSGMSVETGPDGVVRVVQGPGAGKAPAFTEAQSKDVVYATRARGALKVLDPIAGALTGRLERAADAVPFGLARGWQSSDFQVAKNAGDEFLQAILRKDTGAAITADEQALYGTTYLPQPGDTDAVLAAKQQARQRAINAIEGGMSPTQMVAKERALAKTEDAAKKKTDEPPGKKAPPAVDFDAIDRIVGGAK